MLAVIGLEEGRSKGSKPANKSHSRGKASQKFTELLGSFFWFVIRLTYSKEFKKKKEEQIGTPV